MVTGRGDSQMAAGMRIDDFSYGHITVGGRRETFDLLVTPREVLPDWWRPRGHSVSLGDLSPILENPPELILFGTGTAGRMHLEEGVTEELAARGIGSEVLPTAEACDRFNELVNKGREVVAALHLTC